MNKEDPFNLRPLWDAILDIYKVYADICNRHNLCYYLCAGSVLGAVRHGGFIPWDDDFDVIMPRDDYNRFMSIAQKELPDHIKYVDRHNSPEFKYLFAKLLDVRKSKIADIENRIGYTLVNGICMDIFPLDGYPDSRIKDKLYRFVGLLRSCYYRYLIRGTIPPKTRRGHLMVFAGSLLAPLFLFRGQKQMADHCEKFLTKNHYDSTRNSGAGGSDVGRFQRVLPPNIWGTPRMVEFDRLLMPIPEQAEALLKIFYGDYRRLPPTDRQHPTHANGERLPWCYGPTKSQGHSSQIMSEVVIYIPSIGSGGAERQCAYLVSSLKKLHGIQCSIVVTHKNGLNQVNLRLIAESGVEVVELPWFRLSGFIGLIRFFREHRHATLFCYMTFPNFIGGLLARLVGLKKCYGGVRVESLPARFMAMEYVAHYLFSQKTIFNSYRGYNRFIGKHFSKSRCIVISNAIEPPRERKDYAISCGRVRIITVGRFKPSKDYHTLIKVLRAAMDSDASVEAVIIGYGQLENDVRRWISEEKIENRVRILPGDGGTDVQHELAQADIYLSTSVCEGTSNSIMEALNAGLPVVATDVGDNGYLIQEGESGYLRPVGDVEGLSNAIHFLARNGDKRRSFGQAGMKRMADYHSIDEIVKQYFCLMARRIPEI